jgi:hypothetical protein
LVGSLRQHVIKIIGFEWSLYPRCPDVISIWNTYWTFEQEKKTETLSITGNVAWYHAKMVELTDAETDE